MAQFRVGFYNFPSDQRNMRIEINIYHAISDLTETCPRSKPHAYSKTRCSNVKTFNSTKEMEMATILFIATCFVTPSVATGTTNSSLARSSISHTEILVRLLIVPRVTNATVQMKTLYPFITSSDYFYEPLITLGLDLNKDCINQQAIAEKLGTLHSQMAVFMGPLNFAFLYEHAQGAGHNSLTSVLELTSFFLNDTVSYIKRQMREKGFSVPDYPIIPEAKLDELTRVYLNTLVQKNLVTLTMSMITNDLVKIYRNFVIMYMLRDVIKEIDPCF